MVSKVLVIATAALTLLTGSCTAATTDKSGAATRPTTVVLANGTGPPSAALLQFVNLVDQKSAGRLRVELSRDWAESSEQEVLEDVAAGHAELGWTGTRAADRIGVESFRPLHVPFLIDSYAAERAVVGDQVARDMLDGLADGGLTGLALLGDELRFPASAAEPLRGPADYRGIHLGVWASDAQVEGIRALGAEAVEMPLSDPSGIKDLAGVETTWETYLNNGWQLSLPFVTTNAVLWPRTTVIVANPDVLDGLDPEDRDVLVEAADDAAEWSVQHADDDVAHELATACEAGARIATATAAQLASLREAAAPVLSELRADPDQGTLLARVEDLVHDADPGELDEIPDGCAYRSGDESASAGHVPPAPLASPGNPGDLPAGTYRYTLSAQEISEHLARLNLGPDFVAGNAGVWTWTLGEGRWSYRIKLDAQEAPPGFEGTTCHGYYDVRGNHVDFTTLGPNVGGCASETWEATWRRTEDGLAMGITTDGEDLDYLFGGKPWSRID